MACQLCKLDPTSHSFKCIAKSNTNTIFYTNPSKATGNDLPSDRVNNFKLHLDTAKDKPWIWIFDCAGMSIKHYIGFDFTKLLADTLNSDNTNLQKILILQPNTWIHGVLNLLKIVIKGPLIEKTMLVEGCKLEVMTKLEKHGLTLEERICTLKECGMLV